MTDAPLQTPPQQTEPEIHVIPDAFYGAAMKARVEERPVPQPSAEKTPSGHRWVAPVIVGVLLLLVVGAGFVYMNRDLIFPPAQVIAPPPQVVVQTPEPVPPPTAPTDASATSTNPQSVSVRWTDTALNESGFRVDRRIGDAGEFRAVTNLPPNSSSFLDVSVSPGTSYAYRVIALNVSGESAPSNETTATVPSLPPAVAEQPKLPPAGLDSDSDGLTDLEEALFGTNVRNPDTEGDGFLDGNEVFHLYNPSGPAPVRLLDSNLVRIETAPIGWALSIPASWSMKLDAANGSRATIDTKHGELFRVAVESNPARKPMLDWYLEKHPGDDPSMVMQYRSKTGYSGIIGSDLLTTYIPWGDRVFVLTYDLDGQSFINFRTTYAMILNSLMLSGVPQVTEVVTEPLPFEPSATTSGVITQPIPVETTSTGIEMQTTTSTATTGTSVTP